MIERGKLIVIEGPDKRGKTTTVDYVYGVLSYTYGIQKVSRPTYLIRKLLTKPKGFSSIISNHTLFEIDFSINKNEINLLLDNGINIIMDRDRTSNIVYLDHNIKDYFAYYESDSKEHDILYGFQDFILNQDHPKPDMLILLDSTSDSNQYDEIYDNSELDLIGEMYKDVVEMLKEKGKIADFRIITALTPNTKEECLKVIVDVLNK